MFMGTKRIPTIVGIILVAIVMVAIGFFFEKMSRSETKASLSIEPKQVMVTNLSDSGFTVIWQTDELATGFITMTGANGKKYTVFDERDTSGKMAKYITHAVSTKTAQAASVYTIQIFSNGKSYPTNKNYYQVTTLPALTTAAPGMDPAYGSITLDGTKPAEGALVVLTIEGAQTLSTLVRSSGSWIIPLTNVRTQDGGAYLSPQERMNETIQVSYGDKQSNIATDTLNDSPVPDVVLGQSYDFKGRDAKKPTQTTVAVKTQPAPTGTLASAVLGASAAKPINGVSFAAPVDGATLTSMRPLVTGTGVSGKTVTITFSQPEGSKSFAASVVVAKNGTWQYTPKTPLSPGKQSITITTIDSKNKPVAITHTVTIFRSGTQVLGDATDSGTLVTPTPEPSVIPTEMPVVATESATLAAEPMPISGSLLPTILLLLLGCSLLVGGGAAFIVHQP